MDLRTKEVQDGFKWLMLAGSAAVLLSIILFWADDTVMGGAPARDRAHNEQLHTLRVIVMRNVTSRDKADLQQPFNLRVADGTAESIKLPGKIYDVSFLQLFQGDQVRGYGGSVSPEAGRRVLPSLLHDGMNANPLLAGAPSSSVQVGPDGSVAAVVPARRALTWQLTDANGAAVVRERYWLTFQPGEIRVCAGCHGANSRDQLGRAAPSNAPQALGALLEYLRTHPLPDSGENDGGGGDQKSFSLKVSGPRGSALVSGRRAVIEVAVSPQRADTASIRLRVNRRRCPGEVATVTTAASGQGIIRGRVARVRRGGAVLSFTLVSKGVPVAEARGVLSLEKPGPTRTPNRAEFSSICRSFSAFR